MASAFHNNFSDIPETPESFLSCFNGGIPGIILDTDIGNDIDDVLALALLHALETDAACNILAVTLSNPDPLAPAFVSAINTFYKRPNIPIARNPSGPVVFNQPSKYLGLANQKSSDGNLRYPHNQNLPDLSAVKLMRRTLAAAQDKSVVIAQIGFFSNNAALLQSPPDEESPLPGIELIKQKVRFLSVMAGAFNTVQYNNYWLEFNTVHDIPSAYCVTQKWPTPIIWSGTEVGIKIPFPAHSIETDFEYTPYHIVKESYQCFRPTPHERPTWDLTTVLAAVHPLKKFFNFSIPGTATVLPDGFVRFLPGKGSRDRYLIVTDQQASFLRKFFASMCAQQP